MFIVIAIWIWQLQLQSYSELYLRKFVQHKKKYCFFRIVPFNHIIEKTLFHHHKIIFVPHAYNF